ncbi:hypothetical protein AJ78_02397 [Emergomyces pasteurianus Ep9510]|uniref:Uncharacterized protein n=1 Tax=Emergomyces pasteurianus Ep9510 TaxID=1447872 RepID=A0A1J9PLY9_9EURO|nr:hypothetical protein AJ78_02397 [Emergomyces pasteurianus Ep9510]
MSVTIWLKTVSLPSRWYSGDKRGSRTSAKVAQGLIKVKSDSTITSCTKDGLMFEDGSERNADIIILAR